MSEPTKTYAPTAATTGKTLQMTSASPQEPPMLAEPEPPLLAEPDAPLPPMDEPTLPPMEEPTLPNDASSASLPAQSPPGAPVEAAPTAPDQQPWTASRVLGDITTIPRAMGVGAARAAFETKDFLTGETPKDQRSALRTYFDKAGSGEGPVFGLAESVSQFSTGMLGLGAMGVEGGVANAEYQLQRQTAAAVSQRAANPTPANPDEPDVDQPWQVRGAGPSLPNRDGTAGVRCGGHNALSAY